MFFSIHRYIVYSLAPIWLLTAYGVETSVPNSSSSIEDTYCITKKDGHLDCGEPVDDQITEESNQLKNQMLRYLSDIVFEILFANAR